MANKQDLISSGNLATSRRYLGYLLERQKNMALLLILQYVGRAQWRVAKCIMYRTGGRVFVSHLCWVPSIQVGSHQYKYELAYKYELNINK